MKSIHTAVEMIRTICGTLLNAHSTYETHRCSRCFKKLSDFSSIQRGYGPQCAMQDTALFAKTIKANYLMVLARSDAVDLTKLPEVTRPVWEILKDNVIPAMSSAVSKNPDFLVFQHEGNDMRGFVRIIDWILSFPGIDASTRKNLIEIVRELGYVAVAAVMEGKASTGESKIWFENGYLYLKGSSCKPGFAIMKTLDGSKLPRYRGDQTPYQVPARHHEAFLNAAMTYWPCFEEKVEDVAQAAINWLEAQPKVSNKVSEPVAVKTQFVTFLPDVVDGIEFTMIWENDRTMKVVSDLKNSIPWKFRKYSSVSRSWFVSSKHKEKAMEVLKSHYGETL